MDGASEKLSSDEVWIEEIDNEALNEFEKNQSAFKDGFVRIMPYGAVFPRCFTSYEKPIRDFEVRKDDIFVASFPKCGTTWTQVFMMEDTKESRRYQIINLRSKRVLSNY